jgi:hypothetical protein
MTHTAHSSRRLSGLALLCACAILLAWAAPVIAAVTVDSLEFLKLSQDHHVSDVAAEQAETSDASDDPVWLFSSSRAHLQPLTSSLCFTHLTKRTWTPAPPVRPPIVHA